TRERVRYFEREEGRCRQDMMDQDEREFMSHILGRGATLTNRMQIGRRKQPGGADVYHLQKPLCSPVDPSGVTLLLRLLVTSLGGIWYASKGCSPFKLGCG